VLLSFQDNTFDGPYRSERRLCRVLPRLKQKRPSHNIPINGDGFMGAFSIWHLLIVLLVVVLIFGGGKLPRLMGDFAKGIKAFKSGMKEGAEPPPASSERLTDSTTTHAAASDPAKSTKEQA
jgi:sec-independent protein translocase protein TatA